MPNDNDRLAARGDSSPAMGLARLEDLDDFKVADGFPDPRGWDVKTPDGHTIGEVKHLLVDKHAMRVRYLDVELKDEFVKSRDTGRVQIPIGVARLNDDKDDVIVPLDAAGSATIGEETVRVPLMAEQVVAETRVVPTEEVVIRKQAVTEHQVVEGTVRRERVDVDRSGVTDRDAKDRDTRR